jgi:4,5-DOPA dioxygenase extradiol
MIAIPTPEHYMPLMYTPGVKGGEENASFLNDKAAEGSFPCHR